MPLSYREISSPAIEPVSLQQAKDHLRVDYDDDDSMISAWIVAARQYVEKYTNRSIFNRKMRMTCDGFPWPGFEYTIGRNSQTSPADWMFRGQIIRLPKPATVSVDAIKYYDDAGIEQTLDPSLYWVDLISEPARIAPAPNTTWPYQSNYRPGSVSIEYTSGTYELPASSNVVVPQEAPFSVVLDKVITVLSVKDSTGADVVFTPTDTGFSVAYGYAGQMLTANYTVNACPFTIYAAMLLIIGHLFTNRESSTEAALKSLPLGVDELLSGEISSIN